MIIGGLFIACGILLPMIFHSFGMAGIIFLPMHIPVLVAGLLLGKKLGFIIGVITPLLSSLLTGMPPFLPNAIMMTIELGLYGSVIGYLHKRKQCSVFTSLVGAMVAGRCALVVVLILFGEFLGIKLSPFVYMAGVLAQGLPGIVVQLIFIPLLAKELRKILY